MDERPPKLDITIKKRSVRVRGHDTSVTLEEPFWVALKALAQARGLSINGLISEIDAQNHDHLNLSSAARVYILRDLQARLPIEGK